MCMDEEEYGYDTSREIWDLAETFMTYTNPSGLSASPYFEHATDIGFQSRSELTLAD